MTIDPNNLSATARLTFADEFNSLSMWNGSTGVWSSNWWYNDQWGNYNKSNGSTLAGNGEVQWYINDNYAPTASINPWSASGGVLNITAAQADPAIQSQINGYQYTSGMLNSWHSFNQLYGYFEISAKLPAAQGAWPAFWLLQQDGDWPPEIDIFEVLGRDTSTLHTTVHTSEAGPHTYQTAQTATPDLSAAFHRYGMNWQADYITFYFDGHQVAQMATPSDLNEPMYMIINLAVGGGWAGAPSASAYPATLKVDYVHVYADAGLAVATSAGSTGTTTASAATNSSAVAMSSAVSATATEGGDILTASAAGDRIMALGGDDTVQGGAVQDYLRGGEGNDVISGGGGFDDINGNAGNDTLHGDAGDDWVVGGKDSDVLYGDAGNDLVYGNLGADTAYGGDGADTIRGGQGDDVIYGGDGADWVSGDKGSDTLTGGGGADIFHGSSDTGIDRILDFSIAQGDRIVLDAGSTYSVHQSGADTVIDIGASAELILVGVSMSSLQGDWIAVV